MELIALRGPLLSYVGESGIIFQQENNAKLRGVSYSRLSLDPAHPSVVVCGRFEDTLWEVVTIAHEMGHVLNFREMGLDEAREFFCTMFAAASLGLEKLSSGGQRFTLYSEALASLRGMEVLRHIGIADGDLADIKVMLIKLFETYCRKCSKGVVDEVLKHPQVKALVE